MADINRAAEQGLTTELGQVLSIDFVERFGQTLKSFAQLLGMHSLMSMPSGTIIKTYTSSVTLNGEKVGPGEIIPLSQVKLEDGPSISLDWDKKRKAVTMEDIQRFGFQTAILKTDDKLIREIQKGIRDGLLDQFKHGTTKTKAKNLQSIMAQNWAAVGSKFPEDDVRVVSFVNNFDVANYLGEANITVQNIFGMNYVQNFLGNEIVFMHPDVPKGTVYSTASGNLYLAHALMAGGEIAKAFDFTTDNSGIIGVTHDVNKQRLQAETITAFGMVLFAERLDGIVIGTIDEATEKPTIESEEKGLGKTSGDGKTEEEKEPPVEPGTRTAAAPKNNTGK